MQSLSSERHIALSFRETGSFISQNFSLLIADLKQVFPFPSSSMMMIDYRQRPERRQKRRFVGDLSQVHAY